MSVICLSGPTCSGKTSVEKELLATGFARVISHTTRAPRVGEVNGQDYHFVSEAVFDEMMAQGEFIETISFGKARYAKSCISFLSALDTGLGIATVLEPQGAQRLRRYCEGIGEPFVGVWIDCPPHQQAERFIARLLGGTIGSAEVTRLGEMLSIEQDWREWVSSGYFRCELRLSSQVMSSKALADLIAQSAPHLELRSEDDAHGL